MLSCNADLAFSEDAEQVLAYKELKAKTRLYTRQPLLRAGAVMSWAKKQKNKEGQLNRPTDLPTQ